MNINLVEKAIRIANSVAYFSGFCSDALQLFATNKEVRVYLRRKCDDAYGIDTGKTYEWELCFYLDDLQDQRDMAYPSETLVSIDGKHWKTFVDHEGYRDGYLPRKGNQ